MKYQIMRKGVTSTVSLDAMSSECPITLRLFTQLVFDFGWLNALLLRDACTHEVELIRENVAGRRAGGYQ